jgi:putative aminopeptidase FrvX
LESGADIRTALVPFGIDASQGCERIHESALADLTRLLIAYAESDIEIGRNAKPLSGVKGFTHQPLEEDIG